MNTEGSTGGSTPQAGAETSSGAHVEESNLSPTAKFVKPYLDEITDKLRDEGLVIKANEIIVLGYDEDDPNALDFSIRCRDIEAEMIKKANADGVEAKGQAVIKNYFAKLLTMVKEAKVNIQEEHLEGIKKDVLKEA